MSEEFSKFGEAYQKLNKNGFDTAVQSFAEVNKFFRLC
jgi:hypothetical protein